MASRLSGGSLHLGHEHKSESDNSLSSQEGRMRSWLLQESLFTHCYILACANCLERIHGTKPSSIAAAA